jgi:hypothetical protein
MMRVVQKLQFLNNFRLKRNFAAQKHSAGQEIEEFMK